MKLPLTHESPSAYVERLARGKAEAEARAASCLM